MVCEKSSLIGHEALTRAEETAGIANRYVTPDASVSRMNSWSNWGNARTGADVNLSFKVAKASSQRVDQDQALLFSVKEWRGVAICAKFFTNLR